MSEALIELRGVDVALGGQPILRNVSWSLHAGEHWSVLGGNGSGKSTFLRLLRGDVWPAPGAGERIYRFGAQQNTAVGIREQVALVSPELQQRYLRQEWQLSARDVIQTGFAQSDYLYTRLAPQQKEAAELLAGRLQITSLLRRDVQALSTGELRKVLIARALVSHPRILLLDEVCDGLDAAFRRDMLEFIDFIARHGTQVVYTTHRADEALPAITHELVLREGQIVSAGVVRKRTSAKHSLTRATPGQSSKRAAQSSKTSPATSNEALITIADAHVFLDRRKVLRGIDWQLKRGEHWVVLGGNGAGKTTFTRLVASELYPAAGAAVNRFGLTPQNTIWDLRKKIGTVSPLLQTHYQELITAGQVVASGFFSSFGLKDEVTPAQQRRVRALLEQFGMTRFAKRPMAQLSFGELRKILMLRALVHEPELLIFDEPFDGLDASSRRAFSTTLDSVAQSGTQLLIVTHHLDDLPHSINRGLFLQNGSVSVSGAWPGIRAHPKVVELFGRR